MSVVNEWFRDVFGNGLDILGNVEAENIGVSGLIEKANGGILATVVIASQEIRKHIGNDLRSLIDVGTHSLDYFWRIVNSLLIIYNQIYLSTKWCTVIWLQFLSTWSSTLSSFLALSLLLFLDLLIFSSLIQLHKTYIIL